MLNVNLRKLIKYPEVRLLYDSKMLVSHPTFHNLVITEIRRVRNEIRTKAATTNKLEEKLKKYKNNGGWAKEKALEYNKAVYTPKAVPQDLHGHWRSIEFELLFKSAEDRDAFASGIRGAKLKDFVHVKDDGSIKPNDGDTKAVRGEVVLTYRAGNEDAVKTLCRLLRGKAYVNKTCGTHVHFDMRHLTDVEASTYARRLARCVPALRTILPKSRRNNDFCKEVINSIGGGAAAGSRYSFVNLHSFLKFKTLEIRGHSGTINADKILSWIKLCERIMATDLNFIPSPTLNRGDVNTIEELIKQYDFDRHTVEYIKERYAMFNPVTQPAIVTDGKVVITEVEEGEDNPMPEEVQQIMANPVAIPPAPNDGMFDDRY